MDGGKARLKASRGSAAEPVAGIDPSVSAGEPGVSNGQPPVTVAGHAGAGERTLIEAAKRDPARFAELYRDNFGRVYGYIVRRVRDRALAEDLTSDVFHQALANLPRFEWRGVPFGAWLIRIAANAIADRAKRAAKEQEILTASVPEIAQHHLDESAAEIQAGLEQIEYRARLFRLVEALPRDQRRVIAMRFAEEKSIREIALALGRTDGAVKQLQFRALQNLRTGLERSEE